MYQQLNIQTKTLLKNTAKALLHDGKSITPTEVAKVAHVSVHGKVVQDLIDELYEHDLHMRRAITTEGFHITFSYSRINEVPVKVATPRPVTLMDAFGTFGFISTLPSLAEYNQKLYVAYDSNTEGAEPALFDTEDKYEARTQYKALTGVKHNEVRMTRLETFLKK